MVGERIPPSILPSPQILPLLPLRDPDTMTPQSARDALRALAAACADIPPPQVQNIDEVEVLAAEMRLRVRSIAFLGRNRRPSSFSTRWVAGDLKTHDRQARLLAIETGAVVARSAISGTQKNSKKQQQSDNEETRCPAKLCVLNGLVPEDRGSVFS